MGTTTNGCYRAVMIDTGASSERGCHRRVVARGRNEPECVWPLWTQVRTAALPADDASERASRESSFGSVELMAQEGMFRRVSLFGTAAAGYEGTSVNNSVIRTFFHHLFPSHE